MREPLWPLLVALAALLPAGPARADDEPILHLACALRIEPSGADPAEPRWGRTFTATLPFGEGQSLALLDPETGRPAGRVHQADVLAGALHLPGEEAMVLWTRAMSRRAPLVGQTIRPNGHAVSVLLSRPQPGDGGRSLTLFDTETALAWTGECRASWNGEASTSR